ncbi:hypothetical protein GR160_03980 [Flavobacterium sp. Sd200]|uniref:tetratricopeptide repeat-containing sensor histidine kinase n=1 Tax=Flavobacterium sp. Sd200 TaxID=2692211 RepID=UPI0013689823|nr:histidine kinase dimerization/phosphoacceptor domain -containing protein [Flavobacterium sp. Sd200]MXN90375.1 hypothetical protein [Flavobacterium sp. Sd200]
MGVSKSFTVIALLVVYCSCYAQQKLTVKQLRLQLGAKQTPVQRITTLQDLAQAYIYMPEALPKDIDSALYFTNAAEKISLKIKDEKALVKNALLYAQAYRESDRRDIGKKYATGALAKATQNNWEGLKGDCFVELSKYFGWEQGLQDKVKTLEKALEAYRKGGTQQQLADILAKLAEQHLNISENKKVVAECKEAIKIYRSLKQEELGDVYDILGIAYTKLGLYEEGVKYSLLAAKEGEKNGDESMNMASIYNHIGLAHFYNENFELARQYHEKSLEYAIKNQADGYIHTLTGSIVNDMYPLGKKKEALAFLKDILKRYPPTNLESLVTSRLSFITIYRELNDLNNARKYCNELITIINGNQDRIRPAVLFNINNILLSYYYRAKDYTAAKKYLDKNREIAFLSGDNASRRYVYMWSFKLDSISGNYVSAIKNFQKYTAIKDSVFNEAKSNQVSELQISYETEKKDHALTENAKNIKILKQEAEIQKAKIQTDRIIKIVVYVVVGFCVIIMLLLYRGYSLKQRSNKNLEIKQQEIEIQNTFLKRLVEEKQWLLKEIHHRVKNNLQIVMSLLNSQSAYLKDQVAVTAIKNSQHRVHSMSLIHQKLYKSDDLAAINMPEYINELIDYLKDSFDLDHNIYFETEIEDIDMDVSQAVPIGLILNEAITNSIKYAFGANRNGRITVKLAYSHDDYFILTIADDGSGLPSGFDITKTTSLGMKLMQGLSSDLDGNFRIVSDNGTKITVEFIYHYTFNHN